MGTLSPGVVAFDLFGTLVHPLGVPSGLGLPDAEIDVFAAAWRRHRLEISWLLTAMGRYQDWSAVMGDALDVAVAEFGMDVTPAQREAAHPSDREA